MSTFSCDKNDIQTSGSEPVIVTPSNSSTPEAVSSNELVSSEEPISSEEEVIPSSEPPITSSKEISSEPIELPEIKNLQDALAVNKDTIGWLTLEDTNINYPVMQAKDNQFYMNYDIYKYKDKDAEIFIDYRNTVPSSEGSDKNTIVYGHNWTNIYKDFRMNDPKDTMFAQLVAYADLDYAREHPTFTFETKDEVLTYLVVATYYTDTDFYYLYVDPKLSTFKSVISESKRRSENIFYGEATVDDSYITMSTCTRRFGSRDDQRFVVLARLVRDGEDVSEIPLPTKNPSPKYPTWYQGD